MKLKELAGLLTSCQVKGDGEKEVTGIALNSREVKPGDLFVCIPGIPGLQADRHAYIDDAVQAGAAALVVERDVTAAVPTIQVPDARYALALMAAHYHGYPSAELRLIGVTGTNGKTTTSHLIEAVLAHAGHRTGLMGNMGTLIAGTLHPTTLNTQTPDTLQANLRRMREHDADYAVMEVSSQGLDMGRVLGCDFHTAVFTNLTQDHLDYHGTMERYLAAKGQLFAGLGNAFPLEPQKRKFAVLNADDEAFGYLRGLTAAQVITYGIEHAADVRAEDIRLTAKGTTFTLRSYAGDMPMELRLVGKFNVYNALAAIAVALTEQVPLATIREGLAAITGVPGRMEVVDAGQDFLVLADYAHSPDGLDNALSTLKEFAEERIITVFGCGGDRDRTKRPLMGQLAAHYSDWVILTSDNPRSEDPEAILTDIEQGMPTSADASTCVYERIADRRQAIERAVELAEAGDIVIIAGKGHETYQIIQGHTQHFDDREEARDAIRRRMQRA
jgi:UDP-N-acetylmuramoyl-L-alanyl-D-glutamate--2,6-diaminopimelate ligase